MKPILIALTALTLSLGTTYAAPFGTEAKLYSELASWHGAATTPHYVSYPDASLTEVVDGYWATLTSLGYSGAVTETTAATTTYSFNGAAGVLETTFVQTDDAVVVTLSRKIPEVTYSSTTTLN